MRLKRERDSKCRRHIFREIVLEQIFRAETNKNTYKSYAKTVKSTFSVKRPLGEFYRIEDKVPFHPAVEAKFLSSSD